MLFFPVFPFRLFNTQKRKIPNYSELTEFISSNQKSNIRYEEIILEDFFSLKIGLLESAPLVVTEKTPRVLFISGWGVPGGIYEDLLPNRNRIDADYIMLQVQWPGTSRLLQLEEKYEILCKSDQIPKNACNEIEKYYGALFLKIKERSGGNLKIVSHSNGALKTLLAYLTLSAEQREGLSVSLLDIFIPSEVFPVREFFVITHLLFRFINIRSKSYQNYFIRIIIFPFILGSKAIEIILNLIFNLFYKIIDNQNFKSNQAAQLILNASKDEIKAFELLEKTKDNSIAIRDILIMRKNHITGDGFGVKKSYIKLLEEKLLPKISRRPNGTKVELQKMPFGHSNFVGFHIAIDFWYWLNESISRD